jgi:hypothetical protein
MACKGETTPIPFSSVQGRKTRFVTTTFEIFESCMDLNLGGFVFWLIKKMSTFFYAKDKYLLQLELTIPHMFGVLLV